MCTLRMDTLTPGPLWQCTPVVLALGKWRQKDQEFKIILSCIREFRASLGYKRPQKSISTEQTVITVWPVLSVLDTC